MVRHLWLLLPSLACLAALSTAACGEEAPPRGPDALSAAMAPTRSAAYYVDQAGRYFDTLDTSADRSSKPRYAELVARWEWPPWLKLTGLGREQIQTLDEGVLLATPATVPLRDCRAFERQPFARCYVSFDYPGKGRCPIYEEFTFNDAGEVTFVEAWSDLKGLLPMEKSSDRWAEGAGLRRLSTKVPGLGSAQGRIDPQAPWMKAAAAQDTDVADFLVRAQSFASYWLKEYAAAGSDLFARGCGWK